MMPPTEKRMACEDNVDLFNAAIDRPNDHDVVDAARRLCHGCPVRVSCYRHGRDTGSTGVFGGIYLEPKMYAPKGVCRRGHDVTGEGGRPHNGRITCRECERTTAERRKAKP